MKLTKIGHSCLLVEEDGVRILIDPGGYTTGQNELKNLDVILITQEHPDHLNMDSVKLLLKNNPNARIFTNKGTSRMLSKETITHEFLEHKQNITIRGVLIEGFGEKHADIYPAVPQVDNTGYFIANRLFHPGDAFVRPGKPVEILALPVAAPWLTIGEALDYAKEIHPKICFPIHDGMLKFLGPVHMLPEKVLAPLGIQFIVPEEGEEIEL